VIRNIRRTSGCLVAALCLLPFGALAQVTTGSVTGRVVDQSGSVIPAAQVVLISESQNTKSSAVKTNDSGDYVIPNIKADTYSVEVTAPAFKTSVVKGIAV